MADMTREELIDDIRFDLGVEHCSSCSDTGHCFAADPDDRGYEGHCACKDMSETALKAMEEAGYVVVPKEPTENMHNAARDWSLEKYGKPIGRDASDGCYYAMLAASPLKEPSDG